MSAGAMQFAMGGGGSGGSVAGGSEGGFAQHVESAPLILAFLPHGHQSILTSRREGLFGAKMPGLFGDLFEPRSKGLFADLKQRLSGPATHGALDYGTAMSYGENAFPISGGVDVGPAGAVSVTPMGQRGGGGAGIEI